MAELQTGNQSNSRKQRLARRIGVSLLVGTAAIAAVTVPTAAYAAEVGNVEVAYSGDNPWSTYGTAWTYCRQETSNATRSIKVDHYNQRQQTVYWNCYDT